MPRFKLIVSAGLLAASLHAQTAPPTVWTAQYDNARTSSNLAETVLTPSTVNSAHFGLLFKRAVDGLIYAQPLYVPRVTINGSTHNVVYVATMANTVYAFDGDNPRLVNPLWKASLAPPRPVQPGRVNGGQIGILSTPVIDTNSATLYAVAVTEIAGANAYQLHALDLATGQEKFGGPVTVQGSVPGSAPDAQGGIVSFNADQHIQRAALLLYGGTVIVAFAGAGENHAYHGWIFKYNATTLQPAGVYCTTANGRGGGVWMSGRGPAADSSGVYFVTGNGSVGNGNLGESVVKLGSPAKDFFIPDNFKQLNESDWDLGSGGPLLLPGTTLLVTGSKTGMMWVLNRNNLGKLLTGNTQVAQSWQATAGCSGGAFYDCNEIHHLAYWNRTGAAPLLYLWGWNEPLRSYSFTAGKFSVTPAAENSTIANFPGGMLTVSANGGKAGTGVLWATMSTEDSSYNIVPGTLRAFDGESLIELWNSTMNPADDFGMLSKFCIPTVANGKVYLATFSNQLAVYGLH